MFFYRTGCLLPQLIALNFFFGWILFGVRLWLIIEAVLIFFFLLNAVIITKKIFPLNSKANSASIKNSSRSKSGKAVVDIEGEVLSDNNSE